MIFEDPNGTRILYDAGRTVAGADDPRLGKIDVLLVSHMHGDHEGVCQQPKPGVGTCGKPDVSVKAMPNTNTVNFALAKKTTIVMGSEMRRFFGNKLKANGVEFNISQLARFGFAEVRRGHDYDRTGGPLQRREPSFYRRQPW